MHALKSLKTSTASNYSREEGKDCVVESLIKDLVEHLS